MPRKIKKTTRRRKLHRWVKKQRGGFVFSLGAIAAAIAAAVSAAAPAVATSVASAAAAYGTTKLLKHVGGSRRRRIHRR
jgi:hypothetical protein